MINGLARSTGVSFAGFVLMLAGLSPLQVFANDQYCSVSGKHQAVYFSPRVGANNEELRLYKQSLSSQLKALAVGDRLTFLAANERGIVQIFSSCMPGCPDQGIIGQFLGLGGSCAVTKAKADKNVFLSQYVSSAKRIMDGAFEGSGDIMLTLSAVATHIDNDGDKQTEYVVISSMQDSFDNSEETLDAWFVNVIQQDRIPERLPDAKVSGLSINAQLISFWEDIYAIKDQEFSYF